MTNKLQKGIASKLKKIYPLAMSEIRVFEFLKEKTESKENEVVKETAESE